MPNTFINIFSQMHISYNTLYNYNSQTIHIVNHYPFIQQYTYQLIHNISMPYLSIYTLHVYPQTLRVPLIFIYHICINKHTHIHIISLNIHDNYLLITYQLPFYHFIYIHEHFYISIYSYASYCIHTYTYTYNMSNSCITHIDTHLPFMLHSVVHIYTHTITSEQCHITFISSISIYHLHTIHILMITDKHITYFLI